MSHLFNLFQVIQEGKILKDRVIQLKENMQNKIDKEVLISERKEIGKVSAAGVHVISMASSFLSEFMTNSVYIDAV